MTVKAPNIWTLVPYIRRKGIQDTDILRHWLSSEPIDWLAKVYFLHHDRGRFRGQWFIAAHVVFFYSNNPSRNSTINPASCRPYFSHTRAPVMGDKIWSMTMDENEHWDGSRVWTWIRLCQTALVCLKNISVSDVNRVGYAIFGPRGLEYVWQNVGWSL